MQLLPAHDGFVHYRLSHWGVSIRSQTLFMERLSGRSLRRAVNQPVLRVPNACLDVLRDLNQEIVFREIPVVRILFYLVATLIFF